MAAHQAGEYDYVPTETIADAVVLTDGEAEARELQRHLAQLREFGHVEIVQADGGVAAARMALTGRTELRAYSQLDFRPVE